MITRSEAAIKLKGAIAKLNHAVTEINNGRWLEADRDIWDAQDDLDKLQPFIDEVAGKPGAKPTTRPYPEPVAPLAPHLGHLVGSLAYGTPPPLHRAPSSAPPPPIRTAPPPPLKIPVKAKAATTAPPPPVRGPIITPPPEPEPQFEPARVSIFPVEYDDIPPTTFDFAALDSGVVSAENTQMRRLFDSLPEDTRQALRRQYERTGKPVTCKIRTEAK